MAAALKEIGDSSSLDLPDTLGVEDNKSAFSFTQ